MEYFKNCLACISYCIIFCSNYIVHKYTNIYVLKNDQKTHMGRCKTSVLHYQWLSRHCQVRGLQAISYYICTSFCYTCIYLLNFYD